MNNFRIIKQGPVVVGQQLHGAGIIWHPNGIIGHSIRPGIIVFKIPGYKAWNGNGGIPWKYVAASFMVATIVEETDEFLKCDRVVDFDIKVNSK